MKGVKYELFKEDCYGDHGGDHVVSGTGSSDTGG
jgi:hypothetical protein